MRLTLIALLLAALVPMATGCGITSARAPVVVPPGILYGKTVAPLTTDVHNTPVGTKQGEASTTYFLDPIITGLGFAWDKALLKQAAQNGGIEQVCYADYELVTVLGVYGKFTVRVYGN